MSNVAEILEPGWSVCYETRFKERLFIRSWATYRGLTLDSETPLPDSLLGRHSFDFWQELDNDVIGQGGGRLRMRATLSCGDDYCPRDYEIPVEDARIRIEFQGTSFCARLPDDSTLEGSCEGADFLLASNMIPQVAIKIRLLAAANASGYQGAFFSPDALQTVPYSLRRAGSEVRSSLDETFLLDREGWVQSVRLPDKEFTIQRVKAPLPRWGRDGKTSSGPRRIFSYTPPGEQVVRPVAVEVPGPHVDLGATLALPPAGVDSRAAVLFLAGSGRHDRHGFAGSLDLGYHQLLDQIAAAGIVSLRFDKRGAGGTRLGNDALEFRFDQVVEDARAALEYVRTRPEVDGLPLFLIGHSQGGLVGLDLAAADRRIAGVVLLGTSGRPLDRVLQDQLTQQAEELGLSKETLQRQIDDNRTFFSYVRSVTEWTLETVPPKVYAARHLRRWYVELLLRDPLQLIARLRCPILILHGEQDVQVASDDADLLLSAAVNSSDVQKINLPGHDHLFKRVGQKRGLQAYFDRRRRVTRVLIRIVKDWILRTAATSSS